jgi:hypothetical protein
MIDWTKKNDKENKQISIDDAFKLSIKKWVYIVGNDGNDADLERNVPEIKDLHATCGLCEICKETSQCSYIDKYEVEQDCPLIVNDVSCGQELFDNGKSHPWLTWNENKTKENAKKVLNLVRKMKKQTLK